MSAAGKLPTIKDVARRAGVHFTTVSLALREHPRIPAATRARIRDAARELGYRRDPVFMALTERRLQAQRMRKPPRIALVCNNPTRAAFDSNRHMTHFLEGAQAHAEACGYECVLVLAGGGNPNGAALDRRLAELRCAGIILGALYPDYGEVSCDWSRYAVAKIDARYARPNAPFVSNDQMQVVRLGCQRLRALGYRRIGLTVGRIDELGTQHLFTAGWVIEQAALPAAERVPILQYEYETPAATNARRFGAWAREHRLDAVLCNWSEVRALLERSGLRVPRDLAVANLCRGDDETEFAGVVQDHRLVGRKAAELVALGLRAGSRGGSVGLSDTYVPGRWCDGPTAPPCR